MASHPVRRPRVSYGNHVKPRLLVPAVIGKLFALRTLRSKDRPRRDRLASLENHNMDTDDLEKRVRLLERKVFVLNVLAAMVLLAIIVTVFGWVIPRLL